MATITAPVKAQQLIKDSDAGLDQGRDRQYWDTYGLAIIAALVERLINTGTTQASLAESMGVSATTIRNIRNNTLGKVTNTMDASTLVLLAPYLVNPATGNPFTPNEIIELATFPVRQGDTLRSYVTKSCVKSGLSLAQLAAFCETHSAELEYVLDNGEHLEPNRKITWLVLLSSKLGQITQLSKLMGISVAGIQNPAMS